jgi:putative peptidoglycan binding protein
MTVNMYDSVNPGAIPHDAALVASYVDGFGGFAKAVELFGISKCVSISVENNNADVADVEPGAMKVTDLPGWVARQKARGIKRPVVYSDRVDYPACFAEVGSAVSYWTADPVGTPTTLPGRDAVQYLFTGSYDVSLVLPTFPFYPAAPLLPPPPPDPTLRLGSVGPEVAKLQQLLNRHGSAQPPLATDGVFGLKTRQAVENYQAAHSLTVDGIVGPLTWAKVLKFSVTKSL